MMSDVEKSTPTITNFSPFHIPFHTQVIHDVDTFDYSLGAHELLMSGSVGSGKSIIAAHLVVRHCLMYPRSRVLIGRLSLPDLKRTCFQTILEHLDCDELKDGKDYFYRETTGEIWFSNQSEIVPVTWSDKKFKRIRSINASAAWVEELTENDDEYKKAYFEIKSRVGRIPHIALQERFILGTTNPDGPQHWCYDYFIKSDSETRHVYYSVTEENPFLDRAYISQLKKDLDPREARRMLYGEWVDINAERIYYAYDSQRQYLKTQDYKIQDHLPITLNFDFNIGEGKPASSVAYQYDRARDTFHVFDELVIHGFRTLDIIEQWDALGYFSGKHEIIIHGDASGEARDTRSVMNDYEIIRKYLANKGIRFKMEVPRANPPIRVRHNKVNSYCLNEAGETRLFLYKKCKTVDEALRLTALKKGADFTREDDSKAYQHIGTALGYGLVYDTQRPTTVITSSKGR
jgi:hypothetical protein